MSASKPGKGYMDFYSPPSVVEQFARLYIDALTPNSNTEAFRCATGLRRLSQLAIEHAFRTNTSPLETQARVVSSKKSWVSTCCQISPIG